MVGLRRLSAALVALLLPLGLLVGAPTAAAATVTATPAADTFVNKDAPTASFGTATTMRVDDGFPKVAMLRFDAPVAAGDVVTSATLRLHAEAGVDAVQFRVHEYPVSGWGESVTWNSAPSWGPRIVFATVVPGGYVDIDVTAAVQPGEPVAFALVRSSTGSDTKFYTEESGAGTSPTLTVVTEAGTPPPPPDPDPVDERLADALAAVQAAERALQADPASVQQARDQLAAALALLDEILAGNPDPNTNEAPVVNAGTNAVTTTGSATVHGSVSDDGRPTGSTVTHQWTTAAAPTGGTATFTNAAALSTGVTFSAEGVYTLRLTATDGDLTSSDDVVIEYDAATPPPPANQAPTVNAGPDQTVRLSQAAGLTASASDDGLPAGSSITGTWAKATGPGTVTFGNANALSTTATFSAVGTYVLRVTVTDSQQTDSDDLTVTVLEDPDEEPPPPPPSGSYDFDFGANAAYIDTLPTTGPEWQRVVAMADSTYNVLSGDGATDGSGNAFAGGLVWQRTGNTAYRDKVNNALDAVQATSPGSWWHAAANRKVIGWALAGQLVDRPVRDSGGSLTAWGSWLNAQLSVTHGGPSRSSVMQDAAAGWDNNHGSAARASEAAIRAVLGLPLTNSCDYAKAWLGGPHSGHGFVANNNPPSGAMGWTPDSSSWYVPQHYAGVNPSDRWAGFNVPDDKEGAIASDAWRDGGTYPNIGPDAKHYVFGNGHRMTNALVVLSANGCVLWDYADQAAMRWRQWAMNNGMQNPEGSNNQHGDAILNAVYGTSFPAVGTTGGEGIVGGDWLALGGTWPPGA